MSQDINSIIAQLAEIDSASARIMQEAQQEKAKYARQMEEQKQRFDEALQKDVDSEVEKFQKTIDAENKKQIADYRVDCDKDIKKLEQSFQNHGEEWAEEIFQRIIK